MHATKHNPISYWTKTRPLARAQPGSFSPAQPSHPGSRIALQPTTPILSLEVSGPYRALCYQLKQPHVPRTPPSLPPCTLPMPSCMCVCIQPSLSRDICTTKKQEQRINGYALAYQGENSKEITKPHRETRIMNKW
jgi:hypothetical protein